MPVDIRRGSISPGQNRKLHALAVKRGLDHETLREVCAGRFRVSSVSDLSKAQASELITEWSGRPLGPQKPHPRKAYTDAIRLIEPRHESQIELLRTELGWTRERLSEWLHRTFGVGTVRELGTARNAGHCIYAMRQILTRLEQNPPPMGPRGELLGV